MRFDSRYTAIVPGDRFRTDSISEKTVEYEYRPPRRTEYEYEKKTDEKKTSDRMCSLLRPFFLLTLGTPF
jgi:hypothetical protein